MKQEKRKKRTTQTWIYSNNFSLITETIRVKVKPCHASTVEHEKVIIVTVILYYWCKFTNTLIGCIVDVILGGIIVRTVNEILLICYTMPST